MIAYLNLDRVIQIIREMDEPKPQLMLEFELSDAQAEAILNMRLRSLRKLEEMELKREHAGLTKRRKELAALLGSEKLRWQAIGGEIGQLQEKFGEHTPLGKRRSSFAVARKIEISLDEALIEREPLTILCSERGWLRAVRGHNLPPEEFKYKEGDKGEFILQAETTDRLLVFGANGRIYTLGCDKLPRGRGFGEPLRLMIDLPNEAAIVALHIYQPGRQFVLAASDGRGFVVPQDEVLAQTRAGRQVLNLETGIAARLCVPVTGDHVALIGNNRKLLIYPLAEIPVMNRGRGVALVKKTIEILDLKTFSLSDGLSWKNGERTRTLTDLLPWLNKRAGSGRTVPDGFPRNNKFGT